MSQLKEAYNTYIKECNDLINNLNNKLSDIEISNDIIIKTLDKLSDGRAVQIIENTNYNPKYIKYKTEYLRNLKNTELFNNHIVTVNGYLITYQQYKSIIYQYWDSIAKYIIRGNVLSKQFGYIYIAALKNNNKKMKIDKKASFEFLKDLAKDINPEDYKSYNDGSITYYTFINKMKPFTYSKETPNLPKWLIYTNYEYNYYFCFKRNFYISNINSYKFTPSNFINTYERSQVKFQNTHNVEEIIESPLLGNRDKLFSVVSKDSNIILKYKENELCFHNIR